MYYLYSILYLLLVQTRATPAGGSAASTTGSVPTATTGGTGTATPAEPTFFESMIYFLPAMLAMMLVYLLIMKPQAKGGASGKVPELKKNDKVVTAGGVVGTVIKNDPESDTTTLRVDDSSNTRMQFLTSSIVKVLTEDKDTEKSSSGKK